VEKQTEIRKGVIHMIKCPYCKSILKKRDNYLKLSPIGLDKARTEQVENHLADLVICHNGSCDETHRYFLVFPDGEIWKWDKDTNHNYWKIFRVGKIAKEKVVFT